MEIQLTREREDLPDDEAPFLAAVKLGEEELARGEYYTSEQVGAHIAQLFKS